MYASDECRARAEVIALSWASALAQRVRTDPSLLSARCCLVWCLCCGVVCGRGCGEELQTSRRHSSSFEAGPAVAERQPDGNRSRQELRRTLAQPARRQAMNSILEVRNRPGQLWTCDIACFAERRADRAKCRTKPSNAYAISRYRSAPPQLGERNACPARTGHRRSWRHSAAARPWGRRPTRAAGTGR